MNVALSPEHLAWLKAEVDAGRFSSIDDAIAVAIADLKVSRIDDLSWAKPCTEVARESVLRGREITTDEWFAAMDRWRSDFMSTGRNQPV